MTLTEVAAGTGEDGTGTPAIDIVAVHGLNPKGKSDHALRTWTTASNRLWLRDDLPRDFPDARVFIYEYDSIPVLTSTKTRLVHEATEMLFSLDMEREACATRPLVFVAHSLGGILVKQALVNAVSNPEYKGIKNSTRGLAFFATPHAGGNDTLVSFGGKCAAVVNFVTNSKANDLMDAVTRGSQYSDTLAENWKHQLTDYRIVSFYEGIGNVVSRDSAVLGMPGGVETTVRIDADHSNICRFDTSVKKDQDNYKKVRFGLGKIHQAALRLPSGTAAAQASSAQTNAVAFDDTMLASSDLQRRNTSGSSTEEKIPKLMSVLQVVAMHTGLGGASNESMPRPEHHLFDPAMMLSTFLRSFNHFDYKKEFEDISQLKYPYTCDWIFTTSELEWWAKGRKSRLLWFSGYPGIGKSTLVTHLVQEFLSPEEDCRRRLDIPLKSTVLYGMCHYQKNYSASMILSTLIHQMLGRYPALQAFAFDKDKWECLGSHGTTIIKGKHRSASRLWHLLSVMIQNSGLDVVYIIIDALDECREPSATELVRLFSLAFQRGSLSTTPVKILITSQPGSSNAILQSEWNARYPNTFLHLSALNFVDQINGDVDKFVRMEMNRIRALYGYSDLEMERIEKQLGQDESKNFLAVRLFVKHLEKITPSKLDGIFDGVSNDLGKFYRSLVSKLPAHLQSEPSPLVNYVTYSHRPLTLAELAYAIYGQQSEAGTEKGVGDEDITRVKSRIEMFFPVLKIHQNDTVSFFHRTVRDYVLQQAESPDRTDFFVSSPQTVHRDLAVLCLREMILRSRAAPDHTKPWPKETAFSKYAFLSYAMSAWHMHLREAVPPDTPIDLVDTEIIVNVRDLVELWKDPVTQNYRLLILSSCGLKALESMTSDLTPLEILSAVGVGPILELYLRMCDAAAALPMVRPYASSAIKLAITAGNEAVLAILLDAFDISSLESEEYATVLQDSAWSGKPKIVKRVIRLRRTRTRELIPTLVAAFIRGDPDTLNHLAEDGSIFSDRDHFGMTALHALFAYDRTDSKAVWQQHYIRAMDVVRAIASYLLDNKVPVNARDNFGFTALHWVCQSRYSCDRQVIELLVSRGAKADDQNFTGLTPLHLAAYHTRNADAIKCLLELGGASLIGKVSSGLNTPLHWAMTRKEPEHLGIRDGWDSISDAADIIGALLRAGADPRVTNRRGLTPLEYGREGDVDWGWVFGRMDGVDYINITYFAGLQGLIWQDWHRVGDLVAVSIVTSVEPQRHPAVAIEDDGIGMGEGGQQQQQQQQQQQLQQQNQQQQLETVDPEVRVSINAPSVSRRSTRVIMSKRMWRVLRRTGFRGRDSDA